MILEMRENSAEDWIKRQTTALEEKLTQLYQDKERYRRLLESVISYVYSVAIENGRPTKTIHSPTCRSVTGFTPEEYRENPDLWYRMVFEEDRQAVLHVADRVLYEKEPLSIEHRLYRKDGSICWVRNTLVPHRDPNGILLAYDGIITDISKRKKEEHERLLLEEQLAQAQKMESIGRLAGGVAHDFNNILAIILGYGDLMTESLPPESPLRVALAEILAAGERAQCLTRQLLAFSRKQVLDIKITEMNQVVMGMEKMLRRLLGEDIEVRLRLKPNIGYIKADIAQWEQVLMNLCVNARDAMPGGGLLTIETDAVSLDEQYANTHLGVQPGAYVMLSVTDTGIGMDEATRQRVFDPFFTTKEKGKGTGLGLATVYGIVKQHGGEITVYSEPQYGATFKIYLPLVQEAAYQQEAESATSILPGHGETILVVEDESAVRRVVCRMLSHLGYTVMEAETAEACIQLISSIEQIDLLITDVIMPGMNGRQLYEHSMAIRPGLKTLFMSGYTKDFIGHSGILDEATQFISKPFTEKALSRKIREILDK